MIEVSDMKKLSLPLSVFFATVLTIGQEAEIVNCDATEGWACSVLDQNNNCRACSKISYKPYEKVKLNQEPPAR